MALTRPKYSQIYDSDFKNSARVATTGTVTLSGGAPSTVDDIPLNVKDRVLVRLQNTAGQNGIYMVTVVGTGNNGTWVRALDADTSSKLSPGTTLTIEEGTTLGGKLYRMTTPGPIVLGTTSMTWSDVSGGGGSAGGFNAQIQYNDTNAFGGATYFWYNEVNGVITANAGVASSSTSTGTIIVSGGVGVSGALNVGANLTVTGSILPSANVTYDLGTPSQRWKDLYLSGTTINLNGATISATDGSITFQNSLGGSFAVTGSASGQSTGIFGNLIANAGIASTSTSTGALVVTGGTGISGDLNLGGNLTQGGDISLSGKLTVGNDVLISGALTVNGTTTNINTTNLVVEDKNIIIGDVSIPSNVTADGGGITLKGATDKTFNWISASGAWTSSEDLHLVSGKVYGINGATVLSSTTLGSGVVSSSLTSLGTITSLAATTGVITNFSTGNVVLSGGSVNNITIGATTHTTGRFTTITATSISAGTIGNIGANVIGTGTYLTSLDASNLSTGTISGDRGVTAGSASSSFVEYNGTSSTAGQFDGGTTTPTGTTRLNYGGQFYPTSINLVGTDDTATAATHYFVETSTDGYVRPKTLASVKTEIVTTAAVNAAAATTVGTLTGLTVSGATALQANVTVTGYVLPSANLTYNLGSTTAWWNTLYGVSTQAKYADLAENYQADAQYVPGTVLVFGGTYEVTTTDRDHNTAVAGIVSTNPAHLMNGLLTGHGVVALGLTGRLPCRVQGPVAKGDVLVTSTTPGVAQRIDNSKFLPGCVVGKALESINTNNIQTIEVVVGRF